MANVYNHTGSRSPAPVLALLLAAGLAPPAPAEDPQLELGTSGDTRTIRMHAPSFSFDDPRDKEDLTDEGGLGGIFSGNRALSSPSSYETDANLPQIPVYLPLLGKIERSRKQRNWILPPTPEGLFAESDEEEEDALEGGDLRSSAKAIYERAYMEQARDDGTFSNMEGQRDDAAARNVNRDGYDSDSAMSLLLPESGLSLGPAVGLLGVDFGAQMASTSLDPGVLEAAALEGLFTTMDAALPGAELDENDPAFDPETLALHSMDASGGGARSFDFGAGFSASRDPFSGAAFSGNANSGTRGAFDLAPTATRTDGIGDWRTLLSSTASAMQPMQERSSSEIDASAWSGVSQVGRETEPVFGGLSDRFSPTVGDRFTTTPLGSLSGGSFGSLPGTASGSIAGPTSIGGFGMRDNLSTGGSPLSTPSLGSRSIGSGVRSGVRTVDELPNPLGGSLFD